MDQSFLDGRVVLKPGDCRESLKHIPDNSVDAAVTDPPYALVSIVKRFGSATAAPAVPQEGSAGAYSRASAGFMGKHWDTGETAFAVEFWQEVFRVLKPGGFVVAFSGTRTYHRMAVAIEDAGFEIRDMGQWLYGTGFPKSHDMPKAIETHKFQEWLDVHPEVRTRYAKLNAWAKSRDKRKVSKGIRGRIEAAFRRRAGIIGDVIGSETITNDMRNSGHLNTGKDAARAAYSRDVSASILPEAMEWDGWGTALKPAVEPICIARKPCAVPDGKGGMREATVAENLLYWGTGAINVRACKIEAEKATGWGGSAGGGGTWNESNSGLGKDGAPRPSQGRFPANVITDGSPEVMAMFPESAPATPGQKQTPKKGTNAYGDFAGTDAFVGHTDAGGSAARFFYSAKADGDDRLGSNHPTVKPVDLMRWLVRLVCRKGGVVLDPFAGTGTTGAAAYWEGCAAILCEREAEYQADIAKRMKLVLAGPDEKKRARTEAVPVEGLPLFS
ncbi:site-specific DNA-methyltransferase [Neorhizobium sp. T786]|uniref:DNA methyltransferase n=1 Tax=Pseudorhizobium xiangyangii TaxID=2883104 RepID=UPI001CFF6229|nr:DNA methyltransferase [Neorhizobium xiangyangii]MCB5201683.1 site-specific DNA-methyltransferase [Neorhizobium xiangyangii]